MYHVDYTTGVTLSKEPLQTSACGYPLHRQRIVDEQLQGLVNRKVILCFAREESSSSVQSGKFNSSYSVLAYWFSSALPGKVEYIMMCIN